VFSYTYQRLVRDISSTKVPLWRMDVWDCGGWVEKICPRMNRSGEREAEEKASRAWRLWTSDSSVVRTQPIALNRLRRFYPIVRGRPTEETIVQYLNEL
jgi:hypothetical protein